MTPPDSSADQARAAITAALGQIGYCLPGTITIRHARCGKPRCACTAGPPSLHGPYIQWTRTVHGKTVTRLLTPAQYHHPRQPGTRPHQARPRPETPQNTQNAGRSARLTREQPHAEHP